MLAFFFNPSGRIGRAQWWFAQITVLAIVIVVVVMMGMLQGATEQAQTADALLLAIGLLILDNP